METSRIYRNELTAPLTPVGMEEAMEEIERSVIEENPHEGILRPHEGILHRIAYPYEGILRRIAELEDRVRKIEQGC